MLRGLARRCRRCADNRIRCKQRRRRQFATQKCPNHTQKHTHIALTIPLSTADRRSGPWRRDGSKSPQQAPPVRHHAASAVSTFTMRSQPPLRLTTNLRDEHWMMHQCPDAFNIAQICVQQQRRQQREMIAGLRARGPLRSATRCTVTHLRHGQADLCRFCKMVVEFISHGNGPKSSIGQQGSLKSNRQTQE